jgi:hypothetical protein
MMRQIGLTALAIAVAAGGWAGYAQGHESRVSALLQPENEVPAVSSPAGGRFVAVIDDLNQAVDFELTYAGLQADVRQAHIHMAQPNVNGGIMVWLCDSATNPGPGDTPACPQSGTVTGTIGPADVVAANSQGIAAGDFDEFLAAIRKGLAYVNVHTAQSPGGEIRGQVRPGQRQE